VPTSADWLPASKVLYWLMQKRKKERGGKSPPLKTGASQRMGLDALIAVNWSDFEAIRYYCNVKAIKASDFFRR
jgi:hypothetical protein